ncbi:MAG: glutamine-hydrolyzing GMP synthase [Calditrichaeota bacterium]|nr:MAG: glutamine-hydrolyzing GMP synthase [Calditrichota bacterium]
MKTQPDELVLILDFGSQYTQLITRKVRELGVYSIIKPFNIPLAEVQALNPKGLILSGGPESVYEAGAPFPDEKLLDLGIPVLGICYGLQILAHVHGGKVSAAAKREYGLAQLVIDDDSSLLKDVRTDSRVWMSHGDALASLPEEFTVLAHTANSPYAAFAHRAKRMYGVQFHPEVAHTEEGLKILGNFLFQICGCRGNWTPESFIQRTIEEISETVGAASAICAVSGGVDSAVAAALVAKALGERLHCVFVDTGVLRRDEAAQVRRTFQEHFNVSFHAVDAAALFLSRLQNVTDPEEKRKAIGNTFIEIFEKEAKKIPGIEYLVQGTLYPDVIESVSAHGPSATIKTHHNVGGLPEVMNLKLIEPLRELFKDEVRRVGKELGLPRTILGRHPFPGPGLAVRILGEVTEERLHILRAADAIFIEELQRHGWYDRIWQAFAVLLPVRTVGVMGDQRTYEHVIALRAVTSVDGMTADWGRLPYDLLAKVSNRIINEIKGVNRVVYDVSSKPPATIEWE